MVIYSTASRWCPSPSLWYEQRGITPPKAKNEHKTQAIEIKSEIDETRKINPNFYEEGCKTLELSKRLYPLYVRANYEEKAKILSFIASNYALLDSILCPTYRKPFDIIAKGLSRPIKLPLLDEFRNFLITESPILPPDFEEIGEFVTRLGV
ncbi:MAG: hypothetical protein AMJ91_04300 [candidate division Zixibacteria bacterium SM23_73_3]|nr:MAG: hypothetical protein AMJ91_04300 [candidate division Zixibacteria bacterium SM23_73_3]